MSQFMPQIYYAAACFMLVLTFVICGTIRWFHMCRPYDKDEDYFYPSRRLVAASFFVVALQIPYLMNPYSADAWLFVRCFFVIYIPLISSLTLRRYFFFGSSRRHSSIVAAHIIPSIMMTTLFLLACCGGDVLVPYEDVVVCGVSAVSLLLMAYLVNFTVWLYRQILEYQHGEYSDDDDFPIRFAKSMIILPIAVWMIAVAVFLSGSKTLNAIFSVALAIIGLVVLIVILHPQRRAVAAQGSVTDEEAACSEADDETRKDKDIKEIEEDISAVKNDLPEYLKDKLERQIRAMMDAEHLYLQPRLNKTDLAKKLGTNRTYLTIVFRDRFVSFYSYVNTMRMEYALRYAENNPGATNQEIACNSGFGSVKTYTRVKKLYEANKLS